MEPGTKSEILAKAMVHLIQRMYAGRMRRVDLETVRAALDAVELEVVVTEATQN